MFFWMKWVQKYFFKSLCNDSKMIFMSLSLSQERISKIYEVRKKVRFDRKLDFVISGLKLI